MRYLIQLRWRVAVLVMLGLAMLISTTSANAEGHTTIKVLSAVAVFGSVGGLNEIELEYAVTPWFALTSSVGRFGQSPYVDGGLALTWGRFTLGVAGAYVANSPNDRLTGHEQFKPHFAYRVTDKISLRYTHFSNGNKFLSHGRQPNRGADFFGVQGLW